MAFDDFKVANYPKALLSPELHARHFSRAFTGDVVDGLTVTPGTGLQVVLAAGNAMVRYGSGAVASARLMSLVNTYALTIGTADVSNPRIDLVVVYVDNGVTLPSGTPTSANLDGKGVSKAIIVPGTPASSPVAPNSTAIQTAVGAGNPYTVVAQVRVNAGVSVIASDKITDVRVLAQIATDKIAPAAVTAPKIDFSTFVSAGRIVLGSVQILYGNFLANSSGVSQSFSVPFSSTPIVTTEIIAPDSSTYYSFVRTVTSSAITIKTNSATNISCHYIAIGPV